jgi:thymidylate kinase
LKIAFIGTHGVGKTTLCFDLAARMKRLDLSVEIVKEVARHSPLPINRETTLEAQNWILHSQIAQEIAMETNYEAVVCDRSVLDNYAYLVHGFGAQEHLEPLLRHWLASYSALFKVPVLREPSFDGTRDTSARFQIEIDELLDDLITEFEVPVLRLDPRGHADWVRTVLAHVELPTDPPQFDLFGEA